jgi:hypothetical protein
MPTSRNRPKEIVRRHKRAKANKERIQRRIIKDRLNTIKQLEKE